MEIRIFGMMLHCSMMTNFTKLSHFRKQCRQKNFNFIIVSSKLCLNLA